jgi:hypothetical protein
MERVAKAIANADKGDYATEEERYAALARHAVAALKKPFREVDRAIAFGQTRDDGIAMQLGYERGLDAVLFGAEASMAGAL